MQAESNAQEVATLYAVQIVEYIDKIAFEDVTENLSTEVVEMFNIKEGISKIFETPSECFWKQKLLSDTQLFNNGTITHNVFCF